MAYGEVGEPIRRGRRWPRRLLAALLVLLVVVAVLLVIADRVGASVAERLIAEKVGQELDNRGVQASEPEVGVDGFPFLTQVLGEEFESITIKLRDVRTADGVIKLPELDVRARQVVARMETLRTGQGDIVAGTVDGTTTVSYSHIATVIDQAGMPAVKLSGRGGRLLVSTRQMVLGEEVEVTGEAAVAIRGDVIRVTVHDLSTGGTLPIRPEARAVLERIAEDMSVDAVLPDLPFGMRLNAVRPLNDRLEVSATAQNVPLNRGSA